MFLSGDLIARKAHEWVEPFVASQVDCAAYVLRMGDEAYVSPEGRRERKPALIQLRREQPVNIPAGQFAFLLTHEKLKIPYNMIAFINMKNNLKSIGLINVSGFHVDPGYEGKIVFSVFNAGPRTITIRQNDEAFLIWFAHLESATQEYARSKQGFSKIESELIARIPEESASLNSLTVRVEKLEGKISWRKNAMIYVLGFMSALVSAIVAGYVAGKALHYF